MKSLQRMRVRASCARHAVRIALNGMACSRPLGTLGSLASATRNTGARAIGADTSSEDVRRERSAGTEMSDELVCAMCLARLATIAHRARPDARSLYSLMLPLQSV